MANEALGGRCLCGSVTYEVEPPFLRFAHCHCSRCRRATGSAHASNLYLPPERFRWKSGRERVVRYDLPSARSFSTTFCRECGAPLPHHTRSGREIVVPAGSLDREPDHRPDAHIFYDSRPSWSCCDAEIPRSAEYADGWHAKCD